MASEELTDEQMRSIYAWIDAIPLSRPKRNIARDFSDGVMLAEVISAYFPELIELHNYVPANSVQQKVYNFETLNQKVLKKLGFQLDKNVIENIVNCKVGTIEHVLNTLQYKMAKFREKKMKNNSPHQERSRSTPRPERKSEENVQSNINASAPSQSNKPKANGKISAPPPAPTTVYETIDREVLLEKEQQIKELQETVEILELKIKKLEQLVRMKDMKIQKLIEK